MPPPPETSDDNHLPNIIIAYTDQQRYNIIRALGNPIRTFKLLIWID